MIVQCEKCQTRFRLDDAKVTAKGVKVRCAKCKHVFTVHKSTEEQVEPAMWGDRPESPEDSSGLTSQAVTGSEPSVVADSPADSMFPSVAVEQPATETAPFDASAISFDMDDEHPAETATPAASSDIDFSSFDFGDSDQSAEESPAATAPASALVNEAQPQPAPVEKNIPQGLDFSDDDMFGAVVESSPPEPAAEAISFDFGEDSFVESMATGGADQGSKSTSLFALDTPGETPFSLGEIDFGDELTSVAVQQVNPEDLKPSQEILFAPLAAAQSPAPASVPDLSAPVSETAPTAAGELPPLSISSRRKQSPLFGGMIALVALLVVAVLGYFGYSSFTAPKDAAVAEAGKISVRNVKASFVDNDQVGELLVVSGEALNEFQTPRAALQVKVTVFDATGQSVATKSAYGGNPLTSEQLATLSLDKIEAAMANQFGDSLANMEVAAGKAIPFVVVIGNLPKGAKDYSVQSAGSTVATDKPQ